MKNKGFTLVELLAVIVILSIILAIAIPTIGNLIANSKKSMFGNSSKMILRSMKNDYDGKITSTGSFTDTFILYNNGVRTVYPSSNTLDFVISATDGGIVRHNDGTVTLALYDGTNCLVKTRTSNDVTVTTTDKATCISNIIYKQTTAPFANLVTNGDFGAGITGWGTGASSNATNDNTLVNTGDGGHMGPYAASPLITPLSAQKMYVKARMRIRNSGASFLRISYADGGTKTMAMLSSPQINEWYDLSGVQPMTSTTGNFYIYLYHWYVDAAYALNKVMEVQNVIVLNLTSIYGAGNEPTKDQMDNNLNKVWIDTTTNTPKRFTAAGWINY